MTETEKDARDYEAMGTDLAKYTRFANERSGCHHPGAALHEELTAWAEEWARRIHADAPSRAVDQQAHDAYEAHATKEREQEILDSRSDSLRACPQSKVSLVLLAMEHAVHQSPDDG